MKSAGGVITRLSYNNLGEQTAVSDAVGNTTTTKYDGAPARPKTRPPTTSLNWTRWSWLAGFRPATRPRGDRAAGGIGETRSASTCGVGSPRSWPGVDRCPENGEAAPVAVTAIESGRIVPSNWWRATQIVADIARSGIPEANDLREAYEAYQPSPM